MGGVAEKAGDVFEDTVDFVGDALEDTWDVVSDAADWAIDTTQGVVDNALDNPVRTIAQVAAVASGNPYLLPYISAADAAAQGGDIKDIAKAAAVSYAAGQIAQGVSGSTGIIVDDAGIPLLPSDAAAMAGVGSGVAGAAGSQLAGNVAGGAAGNAFASAVMGGDLDQILNASIVGGLGAGTNTALRDLGVPKHLVPVAGGAVAGGAGALLNGGDIYQSVLRGAAIGGVNSALSVAGRELQSLYKQNKEALTNYFKNNEEYQTKAKDANDFLESTYRPVAQQTEAKYNELISLRDQFEGERSAYDNLMAQFEENKNLYNQTKDKRYADAANALVDEIEAAANKANATYANYEKLLPEYDKIRTQAESLAAQYTSKYDTAIKLSDSAREALESYQSTYGQFIGKAIDFNEELSGFAQNVTDSFVRNTGRVPTPEEIMSYVSSGKDIAGIQQDIMSSDDGVIWSDIQGQEKDLQSRMGNELVRYINDQKTSFEDEPRYQQYLQEAEAARQNFDRDALAKAGYNYYKDLAQAGSPLFKLNEDGSVDDMTRGIRYFDTPVGTEDDEPIYYQYIEDFNPQVASDNPLRNIFNIAEDDPDSQSWFASWQRDGGINTLGGATPMGIISGPGGLYYDTNGNAFSILEVGGKQYLQDPSNALTVYEVTPEVKQAIDTADYIKNNDVNKDGKIDLQDAIKANQTSTGVNNEQIAKLNEDLQKALQQNGNNTNAAIQQLASEYGTSTDELKQVLESVGTKINEGNQTTQGALGSLGEKITQGNQATQTGLGTLGEKVEAGTKATTTSIEKLNEDFKKALETSGNNTKEAIDKMAKAYGTTTEEMTGQLKGALGAGFTTLGEQISQGNQATQSGLGALGETVKAGTAATTAGIEKLSSDFKAALETSGNNTKEAIDKMAKAYGTTTEEMTGQLKGALGAGFTTLGEQISQGNQATQSGLGALGETVKSGTEATTGAIGQLGTTLTDQNKALQNAIATGNQSLIGAVQGGNQGVIDALNAGNLNLASAIASGNTATTGAIGQLGSELTSQNQALQNAIATGNSNIVNAVQGGNQGVIDALTSGNTALAASLAATLAATTSGFGGLSRQFSGLTSAMTAGQRKPIEDLGATVVKGGAAELASVDPFANQQAAAPTAQAQNKPEDLFFNEEDIYTAKEGGLIEHQPEFFSEGGLGSLENRYVKGDGDGTSDSIPAMLATGEFVIPADVVSGLGNGDNEAGAKVLDHFMMAIRKHKRAADPSELPEDSKGPLEYLKEATRKVRK